MARLRAPDFRPMASFMSHVRFVRLLKLRDGHTHVFSKVFTGCIEFHHPTTSVMLAMPNDFVGSCFVQTQAERWFVFPHLASDVITAAELIREAIAFCIKYKSANTSQGFCSQELNLGIWIVWLHEASWVYLHPFEVNRPGSDLLAHFHSISSAMLAVCGRKVHEIWPVLRQQRILREVGPKATARENHRTLLFQCLTTFLIFEADADARPICQQLVSTRFGDDAGL